MQLAIAALLSLSGCATFRSESELDGALAELRAQLDGAADSDSDRIRLRSIAERIEIRGRELVAEHESFLANFDDLLTHRDVAADELTERVAAYSERRKWLRDDLLALQDELHDALSPDEWREVLKVLNRTGGTLAQAGIRGG